MQGPCAQPAPPRCACCGTPHAPRCMQAHIQAHMQAHAPPLASACAAHAPPPCKRMRRAWLPAHGTLASTPPVGFLSSGLLNTKGTQLGCTAADCRCFGGRPLCKLERAGFGARNGWRNSAQRRRLLGARECLDRGRATRPFVLGARQPSEVWRARSGRRGRRAALSGSLSGSRSAANCGWWRELGARCFRPPGKRCRRRVDACIGSEAGLPDPA